MDREATAINQFPDFEWHRHTEIIPQTFDSALINMYKARYTANNTFCVRPCIPLSVRSRCRLEQCAFFVCSEGARRGCKNLCMKWGEKSTRGGSRLMWDWYDWLTVYTTARRVKNPYRSGLRILIRWTVSTMKGIQDDGLNHPKHCTASSTRITTDNMRVYTVLVLLLIASYCILLHQSCTLR